MAVGDITAVRINAEGWYAEVDISGLDVGGTYDFNLGTNNDPSACRMVLTVTSEGYDATGTLGKAIGGRGFAANVRPGVYMFGAFDPGSPPDGAQISSMYSNTNFSILEA